MKEIFTRIILLCLLLCSMVAYGKKNDIEIILKNDTYHFVSFKCENSLYPGDWSGSKFFVIESNHQISNPRRLNYSCAIALPNREQKEVVHFGLEDFNHSKNFSEVSLVIHSVDNASKCAPSSHFYRPAEVSFTLTVDGSVIKMRAPVCFSGDQSLRRELK